MSKKPQSPADVLADACEGCIDNELKAQRYKDKNLALNSVNRTLKRRLSKVEADMEIISSLPPHTPRKYPKAIKTSKTGEGNAAGVLMLNDWHCANQYPLEAVEGVGFQNLEEINRKASILGPNTVKIWNFASRLSTLDELDIVLLGDFLHGAIHPEYAWSNSLGPTEEVLFAQDHLVSLIRYLKKTIKPKKMRIIGTRGGNHGRTTKKMHTEGAHNHNLEWLMYGEIARIIDDPSIEWRLGKHLTNPTEIKGHIIRPTHGDTIRFMGGTGGVSVPLNRKVQRWNEIKSASLTLLGHFHTLIVLTDAIVGPALTGYDPFAFEIGAKPYPPGQMFLVMDKTKKASVLQTVVYV